MKDSPFRYAIGLVALGVMSTVASVWLIQQGKIFTGDLLGLLGAFGMVGGASLIVTGLTQNRYARLFFLCGATLLVVARMFDFTEEVAVLEGLPFVGRKGYGQDFSMNLFSNLGYICLLATFIAVLDELATLKNRAEQERQRIQSLYESTLYLSRVADMAADAVFGADRGGIIRSWNNGAEQLFGYTEKEAIGMHLQRLLVPRIEDIGADLFTTVVTEKVQRYIEVTSTTQSDRHFLAAVTLSPVTDDTGQGIGVSIVARDIEAQKRRENELIASRSLLAGALHNANVGMFIVDRDGEFLEFNARMQALTGWQREAPPSLDYAAADIFDPSARLADIVRGTVIGRGEPVEFHNLSVFHSGDKKRICTLAISPINDDRGNIIAAAGIAVDVTEREVLQSRLLESQKMESIGRLAGGIAHDFNNLLGGILGYASLITQKLDTSSPLARYTRSIEESAVRGSELTHQLLAFARGGTIVRQSVSLNEIVRRTVRLLSRSLPPNIELVASPAETLSAIEADTTQMQQLLMNLYLNSRDAISNVGMIKITTTNMHADEEAVRTLDLVKVGPYVQLTVEDNGCGMSPEVVRRIFEPFFSTKEQGKGYGLGMSVVYGIVQSHKARIHVSSVLNKGTRIDLYFPAIGTAPTPMVETTEPVKRMRGGTETLLIVDDEKLIRALLRDILEYQGYTLIEAENGEEAVKVYQERGAEVAIVLLDLIMPGKDGVETLAELQLINPDVRCIISSGYGTDKLSDTILNNPNIRLVPKPYMSATLVNNIRELIDTK